MEPCPPLIFYELLLWWTDGRKPINTRTRALVKLEREEIDYFKGKLKAPDSLVRVEFNLTSRNHGFNNSEEQAAMW